MSLVTLLAEDRRLVILRALTEVQGYNLNESTLRSVLGHFGHNVGRDLVRADIEFLAEHGLVTSELLSAASGELMLVRLTPAGEDVAGGRHHVGVAKRGVR